MNPIGKMYSPPMQEAELDWASRCLTTASKMNLKAFTLVLYWKAMVTIKGTDVLFTLQTATLGTFTDAV